LEIKDFSLPGSNGMKVNIFWPESRMPKLPLGAGDAILIRKAKVCHAPLHLWIMFAHVCSRK
jgi:hypothetical protein